MYSSLQLAAKYLHYYLSASNGRGHGIHSPFVFDFITTVLNDKHPYPVYQKVEDLRQQMLHDRRLLTVADLGAGSSASRSEQRSVGSIAKTAAKSSKYGQLLYRIVKKYKPQLIVELGTSLGITTSYLASGADEQVVTFEGATEVAQVARQNFINLEIGNVELVEGNFDTRLVERLKDLPSVDLCFIDGNHRKDPTLFYFEQLFQKTAPHSILVFDDIHWSREMEEAWTAITAHPSVRYSVDLFFIGIVFFREEFKEKQNFVLRF